MCVGVAEDLRDHVDRQVERNFGDPRLAGESLVESRRIASLAEQQPHGGHRRRAGTQVQAEFRFGPWISVADLGQFAVGNSVDRGVVRGLVQNNLNQIGFNTQPSNKPLAPLGGIIAEQPDFVERLRRQQRLGRAEISVLGQNAAELRHQGFARVAVSEAAIARRSLWPIHCRRTFRCAIGGNLSQSENPRSGRHADLDARLGSPLTYQIRRSLPEPKMGRSYCGPRSGCRN